LIPSTVGQAGHELTVQVIEGRSLAALDAAGIMSDATSDPYISLVFPGSQPVSVSRPPLAYPATALRWPRCAYSLSACPQTNMRKSTCNPRWHEKLVLPMFLPAMQDTVKVCCWDWNATGADEAIGVAQLTHSEVVDRKWEDPRWLHLYGGPTEGSNMRSELANSMNEGLTPGTHYRGSILMCAEDREEDEPKAVGNEGHGLFGRGQTHELLIAEDEVPEGPVNTTWVLWLDVLEGNDLPVEDMGSVIVEIGHWRAQTSVKRAFTPTGEESADFRNGRIVWYEMLELRVQLPNDIRQVPDIFISIMQGKQRKSYLRYRPFCPHGTSELQAAIRRKEMLLPIPGNGAFLREKSKAWGSARQGETWMMPKWQFLKVDPFSGAGKEEFAGNLLFGIGFGREVDLPHPPRAKLIRPTFENGRQELYTVRAHIYQARDLPSADENGASDPYVMLRVAGHPYQMTDTKFETRFPVWYQTLTFDGVSLPAPDDITRNLGPMLTLLIMDEDESLLSNERDGDFLGRVQVPSGTVNQSNMPSQPTWYDVFSGNSNMTKGQLLVSFQLIPSSLGIERFPLPTNPLNPDYPLTPKMRQCMIEIVLMGARGLLNSSLAKSEPRYIKLSVEGVALSRETSTHVTKKSNRPTQCDPNFLEMIKIKAAIPEEAMFLPVINVSVLEAVFFGMSETTLSTCAIDLSPYIPWDDQARRTMEAKAGVGLDAAGRLEIKDPPVPVPMSQPELEPEPELEPGVGQLIPVANSDTAGLGIAVGGVDVEMLDSDEDDSDEDDDDDDETQPTLLVDPQKRNRSFLCFGKGDSKDIPLEAMSYEQQQQAKASELEDAAAAVKARNAAKKRAVGSAPKYATDTYDMSEAWTKGRKVYDDELEDTMKTPNRGSPFEQWTLMAGQAKGDGAMEYPAGQLKALISIVPLDDPSCKVPYPIDVKALINKKPEALLCRVYIISATGLVSRDSDGGSDPYLKLRLGRKEINDSKNKKSETLNPQFRSMFEFEFLLPGEAQLHIELYDWDMLGFDEMIGATAVDLENRWFSKEWRSIGAATEKKAPHMRPVELRTLHVPGRRAPQGKLKLWVEIMPKAEVKWNPPVPIKRPEPETFELRVCIFRGRRLPLMDSGDLADFFCAVAVDGTNDDDNQSKFHLKEETDTHFRAKGRKATWNWRLKFEIHGPVKSARMSLQCYDFDVIGASDICGEWMYTDLEPMIARAVGRWRADKRGTPQIVSFPTIHGKHDREWVKLTNEAGEPAGEIEIQMQLVHKDLWKQHPAGVGRAAPNANPKMQEPQDRMSMNFLRPVRPY
jgi:hypothetical protein